VLKLQRWNKTSREEPQGGKGDSKGVGMGGGMEVVQRVREGDFNADTDTAESARN